MNDDEIKVSSKKKKKKHNKSEHHKKHKHKHRKNKDKYEQSTSIENLSEGSSIVSKDQVSTKNNALNPHLFPRVEQMDGDLRVRIKSPPPAKFMRLEAREQNSSDLKSSTDSSVLPNAGQMLENKQNSAASNGHPTVGSPGMPTKTKSSLRRKGSVKEKSKRPQRSSSRAESLTYDERSEGEENSSSGDCYSDDESGEEEDHDKKTSSRKKVE